MPRDVEFDSEFEAEFDDLPIGVRNDLYARAAVLEQFGPALGRPAVDSHKRSRHPNMKELRFNSAERVWRVEFAFDRSRRAVLLAAGDKSGLSERLRGLAMGTRRLSSPSRYAGFERTRSRRARPPPAERESDLRVDRPRLCL